MAIEKKRQNNNKMTIESGRRNLPGYSELHLRLDLSGSRLEWEQRQQQRTEAQLCFWSACRDKRKLVFCDHVKETN